MKCCRFYYLMFCCRAPMEIVMNTVWQMLGFLTTNPNIVFVSIGTDGRNIIRPCGCHGDF